MKRFVKLFSVICALMMSLTVAAACSDPTTGSNWTYRGENVMDHLGPETGEITFQVGGGATELELWDRLISAFEEANPGITVRQVTISSSDTLYTMLASGNAPDVIQVESPDFGNWAKNGALMSIQPFIDQENFDTSDFWPQALEMFSYDTTNGVRGTVTDADTVEIFSLPKDFGVNGVFVNRTLVEAAYADGDLTKEQYDLVTDQVNPMTFDEYLEIAVALTDNTGDSATTVYGSNRIYWESYLWSLGDDIVTEDHQLNTDSENFKKVLEYSKSMVDSSSENYCAPYTPSTSSSSQDEMSMFTTGRIAMFWSGRWNVPNYDASNVDYYCIPCPVAVKEDGTRGESVGWCSTVGYTISRNCEKTQMAWKLIKFLTSQEGYRIMNELNYAVPGRMSLITEEQFADPSTNGSKLNKESASVFFNLAKTARVNNSARYSSPRWIEEFEERLDLYFTGDYASVEELMEKTERAVNSALQSSDPQLFE